MFFLFVLVCILAKPTKEVVELESNVWEIGLEGNNINLNVTSLDNIPFDLSLWRNGKIEKFRQTKLVIVGDFQWLTISSQNKNRIKIKWEEKESLNGVLFWLILLTRILMYFEIKWTKSIFMFLVLILAIQDLNPHKFMTKLIHSWSVK